MRLIHVVEGAWFFENPEDFVEIQRSTKMVDIFRGQGPGVVKLYKRPPKIPTRNGDHVVASIHGS